MLSLLFKYYLTITFLPRSSINRPLNFTDVYICFWFSVKTVLLILCLTKCNTRSIFICFILLFYFCTLTNQSLSKFAALKFKAYYILLRKLTRGHHERIKCTVFTIFEHQREWSGRSFKHVREFLNWSFALNLL